LGVAILFGHIFWLAYLGGVIGGSMSSIVLFCGGGIMVAIGLLIKETSFSAVGLGLIWMGFAVFCS